MYRIEKPLHADAEMMKVYYDEMASSIYGPHWWVKPGCNRYQDLTPIQQEKFLRIVMSMTKNNGVANSGDLWRFTNIVRNEPHMRLAGKLGVVFGTLPRLLIMIGLVVLILFGLSLILLLVF